MDRGVALMLTLLIGALIALQPATNNMLSKHTGALGAAFTSLLISTLIVTVLMIVTGETGGLSGLSEFRPVHLIGGIAGAAVVAGSIVLIRPLGATALTAALVTTQLGVSAVIDWGGWFGVDKLALSWTTVLGLLLLVLGTLLVATR